MGAVALCFILIGIPFVIVLPILHIILVIVAAVKANQGMVYRYPLAIPFFR